VNTGTNLPAQIDLYSVDGDEYKFLCVAKGGGSANKTYLYQETKALLTPGKLKNFLVEKMRTLGTAACPPYHIAFVIGRTSAESTLKTVKLASTHYYDALPTEGNAHGQAFRDLQLEQELLIEAQNSALALSLAGNTSHMISL
jgi:fumarate hydratase class I